MTIKLIGSGGSIKMTGSSGGSIKMSSSGGGGHGGGDFNISDFALYKSYHDESTATQIISHLTAAP